ncbi:hypothetical protein ACKWTF_005915 [Chironomus riparius]
MSNFWSLNCGKIESEAKFYAWFGITLNIIIAVFAMYWTVFLIKNPCETIIEMKPIVQITRMYTESKNCETISTAALMTATKVFIVAVAEVILLAVLLLGIKKRNPAFIHHVFVYYIVSTIMGFFWELSAFSSKGYLLVIFPGILHLYFIYILYALYSKVSSEYQSIENVELQRV